MQKSNRFSRNEKYNYRKNYAVRAQENLLMTQANKDYKNKLAQEKADQQREYSETLSSQLKLKEEINTKYGTMSDQERKMNRRDLSVFISFRFNKNNFRLFQATKLLLAH